MFFLRISLKPILNDPNDLILVVLVCMKINLFVIVCPLWVWSKNLISKKAESIMIRDSFDLSFEFRTNSRSGIMAIVVDNKSNDSFFLELTDSQVREGQLDPMSPIYFITKFHQAQIDVVYKRWGRLVLDRLLVRPALQRHLGQRERHVEQQQNVSHRQKQLLHQTTSMSAKSAH